jgi:arabinofuranosyltransferase
VSVASRNILIPAVALALFAVLLLANAWVVDDAYITFRTVDNIAHGLGATWNPDERVDVYTHPLWMLIVTLFYLVTSELFFTVVILSCALTLAAVWIAWSSATAGFRTDRWKGGLLFLALIASKAVIDYASSGLENCLSYLIAAVFVAAYLRARDSKHLELRQVFILCLLASLAFVNRADTLLLFVPALVDVLYRSRHLPRRTVVQAVLVAAIPAVAWVCFSLVYYGYPFSNTVYAKVICTGFPAGWKLQRGLDYLGNSLRWDAASYVMLVFALWFAFRNRSAKTKALMAGVVLYFGYVVLTAASATHMSGRFFAVPLFVAIILFVHGIRSRRAVWIACASLAVFIVWSPVSALKFGTSLYHAYPQNQSYIDAKWYVGQEGAALINWRPGKRMPDHVWYHQGEMVRQRPERVVAGGADGRDAVGYVAFAAGPKKHFIDTVGLGDPLLARLPAKRPASFDMWKSGHFHREIPEGYAESLLNGTNQVRDAELHEYYDHVRTITRGPVFDWNRFKVIVAMNLGKYDYLLTRAREVEQ